MKENKTVLITGATSGIGYELSHIFAKNGYNLVLVARNKQRLAVLAKKLAHEFTVSTLVIPKDLSHPASPREIYNELETNAVKIDILVNNADFNEYGLFVDTDLHKEIRMIQLNIVSLTVLTKLLLPRMVKTNAGKILNVGSTGSFVPRATERSILCHKSVYLEFFRSYCGRIKREWSDGNYSLPWRYKNRIC